MSPRIDDSEAGNPDRPAGAFIGLLGVLSIVVRGPPLSQVQGITAIVLTVVLPSLLGFVLIGVGYGTARGMLVDPEDAWRFAGWVVVGMVVFLLVGLWIVVLDVLLGQPVPFGFLLTMNAVTLGGIAGAVIGQYDAQNREYTRKLQRRERELEEQNQRLDEFVSIVSHDLRNPLSVAEARLDVAQAEHTSEHLDHVARSHERMETLIDDLLQLARQNESVTDVESVSLPEMIRDAWRNVDTAEAELGVETDLRISADRSRLQQLLENLFRNAIEHGGETVTVTIGGIDDGMGFYIEDDGPGIPANEQEQVFESGYTTRTDGTGFGLSIVSQVVDAHGWEVSVTDGKTGGARFEITGVETGR